MWRRILLSAMLMMLVQSTVYADNAMVLTIEGGIGPATADYIERNIAKAQLDSQFVIITMDTPGGLDKSTRYIIKTILGSKIPIVVFVKPSGARAASAGTYILYASNVAVMAPGTHLGAASPVSMSPGMGGQQKNDKKPSTMTKKVTNDAIAYIRTLAQLRGRDIKFAEKAVRDAATMTASEALKRGVIDLIAVDEKELLQKLNGYPVKINNQTIKLSTTDIQLRQAKPDWRTQVLLLITSPTVAYLLLLLGIYGIFFELVNPGFVLPGVVGAIAIVMAMYALHMLPISYAGLGLIALGVIFMIAEAFVPSFGALGIGGVVAFIIGSFLLIDTEYPSYQIATSAIWAMALVNALFFSMIMSMAIKARQGPSQHGLQSMIGASGVTLGEVNKDGQIKLNGEIWKVKSQHAIAANQAVKVTAVDGLTLVIEEQED